MAPTVLGTIFVGICAIILCAGLAAGEIGVAEMIFGTGALVFVTRMVTRSRCSREEEGGLNAGQAERIEARLTELERRLTDIQEVQIALSERAEYAEGKPRSGEG